MIPLSDRFGRSLLVSHCRTDRPGAQFSRGKANLAKYPPWRFGRGFELRTELFLFDLGSWRIWKIRGIESTKSAKLGIDHD